MIARNFTGVAFGIALLMALPDTSAAQLRLAPLISDGMVLQRQATVPVWGWTDRSDTVVVTFDRQTYTAIPDTSGQWTVKLRPRPAGGPYEMSVAGKRERFTVRNILVGDVWICSGQSNMKMTVGEARNATQEIAAARDWKIRHFQVPRSRAVAPVAELAEGTWAVADSAHVGDFTAVGYYFARELRKSVDVPIGIIHASVGGTAIEDWMSREALHLDTATLAKAMGTDARGPTGYYNQMIHPLLRYPIKGILWYQGEANSGSGGIKYRELLPNLIADWRRAWGLGDIPFLFVQLPNIRQVATVPNAPGHWVLLREAQDMTRRVPNTAQIITIDVNDPEDALLAHPMNKQDIGARSALAARHVAYGEKIEYSGPLYRRHTFREGRVIIEFDHIGRGLTIGRQGGELQGFTIAGADRQFVWANAKIEGDRVIVWSDKVPQPAAVRYAWADNPYHANLYHRDGLPAGPFRTDDWPYNPSGRSNP